MIVAAAVFHFNKNEGVLIFHDQVNFAEAAGEITMKQLQALR